MTRETFQPGWIVPVTAAAIIAVAWTACLAQLPPATAATTTTAPAVDAAALASLPHPTRVSLRLRATPAKQAFLDLFRQANLPTDALEPALDQTVGALTVTAELVDVPFLVALLELCRQCHVEPIAGGSPARPITLVSRRPSTRASTRRTTRPVTRPFSSTRPLPATRPFTSTRPAPWRGPLGMTSRPTTFPFAATLPTTATRPSWVDNPPLVRGPFVFVARSATRWRQLWLEQENAQPSQRMELSIQMLVDPKVRLFELTRPIEVEVAQDEQGRSLAPPHHVAPRPEQMHDSGDWTLTVTAPLAYPPDNSRRLALLRGRVRAAVVTRTAPIEITDFSKPAGERRAGEMRFTFDKPRPEPQRGGGGVVAIPVTIHRDGRDEESWRQVRDLARDRGAIRATDDAGRAMVVELYSLRSADNDQSVRGEIRLRPESRPGTRPASKPLARLIWDVPVEVQDVVIPLEFSDLELP